MPSRYRRSGNGNALSSPVLLQDDQILYDDLDVELNYSDDDEERDEEEEGSVEEHDQGSDEGEGSEEQDQGSVEGDDEEESVGEGCAPSVGARVSGGAAPTCPVCMEAWTAQGAHRISCIPCGHVYGRSCLERWLTQRRSTSATCPQCGRRFKHKDIINLYAPAVTVPNDDLERQMLYLREKADSLEKRVSQVVKHEKLLEELSALKGQIMSGLRSTDGSSSKRQKLTEHLDGTTCLEPSASVTEDFTSGNSCRFVLQNELFMDGARVMGIDVANQIILATGRAPGVGGEHVVTKISMLSSHEAHKIRLPANTKAVRDIRILPGGSAIFASLGKRLSFFSMTTDSVVLQCVLPAPGWSCSADEFSSHHVYAGLQNGMLLAFDIRQIARPLHSMVGLSTHPVHTLHSVTDNNGVRKVLSASARGPCMWNCDGNQSRPILLTGTDSQRVCISLACTPASSDILVASFRPKVEPSEAAATTSQAYLSQTPTPTSGSVKLGHHALIRRTGDGSFAEDRTCYANVSELRLSKSAIIPWGNNQHVFAYGDESLRGIRTWQLPRFDMHTDLSPHRQPVLDLRYAESSAGGERYLGCLSQEKLQVFRIR